VNSTVYSLIIYYESRTQGTQSAYIVQNNTENTHFIYLFIKELNTVQAI